MSDQMLELEARATHARRCAIVQCMILASHWYMKRKHDTIWLESEKVRQQLMDCIRTSESVWDVVRMCPSTFDDFCTILMQHGGLRPTKRASVEEQVAKFLWIIGHNVKNRDCKFFFRRSGETVSRHFHNVLRAVIELEDRYVIQPNGSEVPSKIMNSSRFYPFFKDCIGAINGTHIRVKVSPTDAPKYHGRKDWPTTNVLAACDFDLKFTYVLAGWEGTTSDSRIIKNALSRLDSLRIPQGKYYLMDAGFMLKRELITPYRGERYHLKEYSTNSPRNSKGLFNHRHASLRNAIVRTFGILKKRFSIIASGNEPHYNIHTLKDIILACCIVRNYLMGVDLYEELIAEVDRQLENEEQSEIILSDEASTSFGEYRRDSIAFDMWNSYNNN